MGTGALWPAAAAAAAAAAPPALDARAAVLMTGDGQRLFGLQADRRLPIASTTKIMTALVTLEHARLSTILTAPDYYAAANYSQIGLRPGERMSVHDLLLALLLPSADDAAEDLAYNLGGGSVSRFVELMNQRARQLGLRGTHYSTPIGLDTPGNYSTAADLARLAAFVQRTQPFFARAVAAPRAVLQTGAYVRSVVNLNDLVARFRWIDGVKTGHTLQAGYVLVGSAQRDGMRLFSVVLDTPSEYERDAATLSLLDYGFAAFAPLTPVRAGQLIARVPVSDQPGRSAPVVAQRGFSTIARRGAGVQLRPVLPSHLAGPQRRGARVGSLLVRLDGREVASLPLVLERPIPALSAATRLLRFLARPITLLCVVLLLVLVAGAGLVLSRREGSVGPRERARA